MNPRIRTGLTHAGSIAAGSVATIGFMSQHGVDLYAMWSQLNTVVADISKLVAMVTPFATMAFGVYHAGTGQKLADIFRDPKAVEVAKEMPVTPQSVALAEALIANP